MDSEKYACHRLAKCWSSVGRESLAVEIMVGKGLIRLQEIHAQKENAILAGILEHTTYGNRTEDTEST